LAAPSRRLILCASEAKGLAMRYVIEFLVPAMIVIVVAVVLFRNRTNTPAPASASQAKEDTGTLSTGTFVAILIIGATFTVALIYALHNGTP